MVNPLVPSFRLPISIPEDAAHPAVREALLTHDNGLVVLNQALKALNTKFTTLSTTTEAATSTTTIINNSSEVIEPGTSAYVGTVNNQTGATAYTTVQSDNGVLLVVDDAAPVAITLTSTVTIPFFLFVTNLGAGTATLTPTSGTINGAGSLPFDNTAIVAFDGTNWWSTELPVVPVNTPGVAHEWLSSYNSTTGVFTLTRPDYSDLTGTPQLAQTFAAVAHEWLNSYSSVTGLFTATQPAFTDISGTPSTVQVPFQSLTTTGTGAATLAAGVLNVPTPTIPAAPLSGTSTALGGSAMTVGQTVTVTVAIVGATTAMVACCSPVTATAGFVFDSYVSSSGTVTVRLTCVLAGTPASSVFNVRVLQ